MISITKRTTVCVLFSFLSVFLIISWNGFGMAQEIDNTEEFISTMEEKYGGIDDLTASVKMMVEPPLQLKLWAITDTRLLRLEYMEPPQMKGQFFLLKENFLYQYMPARDLIIKKDLTQENIPIKAANLTPDYLLELMSSEDLRIRLIGKPLEFRFPSVYREHLDFSGDICPVDPFSTGGFPLYSRVILEQFVVEIVPRTEKYQFLRQIIVFNKENYLPIDLFTYLPDKPTEPIRTSVLDTKTNSDIGKRDIAKLPEDAEVISG